jgi:hypothetical protein
MKVPDPFTAQKRTPTFAYTTMSPPEIAIEKMETAVMRFLSSP